MSKNTKLWTSPWRYTESIIITTAILIYGILLDALINFHIPGFRYPVNAILAIIFPVVLILFFIFYRKSSVLKWLYSAPAAICAISLFLILSLIMALVPQNPQSGLIIYRITTSWTYLLSYTFLLVTLGLTVLKRGIPFKKKNLGFLMNHFGLWLTLFSAGLGSGDIQTMYMTLTENHPKIWYAYNQKGEYEELTFALRLTDFYMEVYDPKIAIVNNNFELIKNNGKPLLFEITNDLNIQYKDQKITVKEFYKDAIKERNEYYDSYEYGSVPAAKIIINDGEKEGWIAPETTNTMPDTIKLDESAAIMMLKPEAKHFSSGVIVFRNTGKKYRAIIEVNKPLKVDGWKIYQLDYDQEKGKWSEISILQLVKDPWLPLVYAGCFLMMAGAFYLIVTGRPRDRVTEKPGDEETRKK